jgi:hypothetical protein
MASKTSPKIERAVDSGLRRISHGEMVEKLVRRRAELGEPEPPRNSGARRTPSKRALLRAIAEAGGKW